MLDIFNGRKAFYQWDSGQKLTVSHAGICEVHFHHPGHDSALVVKIYELEGQRVADVPNILLQEAGEIIAYIYLCIGDECTVFRKKFEVIPRQKPADYVYTETETKTYKALEDRIKALEQGGGGSYGSENAGKLLYVASDGRSAPLDLGAGLEIRDGVLFVTGAHGEPDIPMPDVNFSVNDDGSVVIQGATFTVDDEGNAIIGGLAVDADGHAVI